jgi:hypothetical protein
MGAGVATDTISGASGDGAWPLVQSPALLAPWVVPCGAPLRGQPPSGTS